MILCIGDKSDATCDNNVDLDNELIASLDYLSKVLCCEFDFNYKA